MRGVTILFCFFCESDARRKYLDYCLQSLIRSADENQYLQILAIDGSNEHNYLQNKKLFSEFKNCTLVHDVEVNPILRMVKHLGSIKTDYTFKLLEDCIFHNYDWGQLLELDMELLETRKNNCVIQYPTLPTDHIEVRDGRVICHSEDEREYSHIGNSIGFIDRITERIHHNYLCNNVLYKTSFLKTHIEHYANVCSTHSAAESDRFDNIFSKSLLGNRILFKFTRVMHKLIYRKRLISQNLVTENCEKGTVLHIGYESTESTHFDNPDRRLVAGSSSQPQTSFIKSIEKLALLLKESSLKIEVNHETTEYCFSDNVD